MPIKKQQVALDDRRLEVIRKYAATFPDDFVQDYFSVVTEGGKVIPFKYAWVQEKVAQQIQLDEKAEKPVRRVYLKWRRAKVTSLIAAREIAITYGRNNLRSAIVSHRADRSEEILHRGRFYLDSMPKAFRVNFDRDNNEQIRFEGTNQEVFIGVSTQAKKVRGDGLQRFHSSEWAFQDGFQDMLDEVAPVIVYEPGTSIIWESTGSMRGTTQYDFWKSCRDKETIYDAEFLNWTEDPTMIYIPQTDKERDQIFSEIRNLFPEMYKLNQYYKLDPGHSLMSYFLIKTKANSNFSNYCRDFPYDEHMAWQNSGESFFDNFLLRKLRPSDECKWYKFPTDEYFLDFDNPEEDLESIGAVPDNADINYMKVWRQPTPGAKYVISGDTSKGETTSTFSSAYVIDMVTREMMATFHGRIRPDQFAHILSSMGHMYNDALCAPETNYTGTATLIELQKIYHNVYMWKKIVKNRLENTGKPGWTTSHQTRPMLLFELKKIVEETAKNTWGSDMGLFRDRAALDEMMTFGFHGPNGKLQAVRGCFDDRVMALGIAHIVASHEVYGTDMDLYTKNIGIVEGSGSEYYYGSQFQDPVADVQKKLGFEHDDQWSDMGVSLL